MWIRLSLTIVLLLHSLGPIRCAHIFLEPLIPLRGQPYMAHCLIGFVQMSEIMTPVDVVLSLGEEVGCTVPYVDYYMCDKPMPDVMVDRTCGCSGKFVQARIANESQIFAVVVRFYLFFGQIQEKINGKRMLCHYQSINDNKTFSVIDFTHRPESQIFMCKTGTIDLTWDFNYTSNPHILAHYKPKQLVWVGMPHSRHEGMIDVARFIFTTRSSKGKFAVDKMTNVRLANTGFMPQLRLVELEGNQSMVIQLNLTFFPTEVSYVFTKKNRYDRSADIEEADDGDWAATIGTTPLLSARPGSTNTTNATIVTSIVITTTSSTPASSTPTRLTPKPINHDTKKVVLSLIDEAMINVTMPPSAGATVAIDNSISFSGNRLLTCLVNEMPFAGTPVVNLTIWKDDKIEMTVPNVTKITKMFANEEWVGVNISCGLTGKATMCLSPNDPRVKPFTKGLKEFVFKTRPPETIDVWLALYACQVSSSLIMMIWTLSLVIRHVGVILKFERRKHEFERYRKSRGEHVANSEMDSAASKDTD